MSAESFDPLDTFSPATVVSVTPVLTGAGAYSSGNAVGPKQTIASAARKTTKTQIMLQTLTVTDKANQKAALTILFFDSDPTAGTYTDKSALALSTDLAKVIGKVNVAAADYETIDSKAVACLKSIGLEMQLTAGATTLYAAVLTTGTPTYTSTSDLTFRYGVLQS